MILHPPLFPFPLLLTAKRIFRQLFPIEVPNSGLPNNCSSNAESSFFKERYFFVSAFASRIKFGVGMISQLIHKFSECYCLSLSLFNFLHFPKGIAQRIFHSGILAQFIVITNKLFPNLNRKKNSSRISFRV